MDLKILETDILAKILKHENFMINNFFFQYKKVKDS